MAKISLSKCLQTDDAEIMDDLRRSKSSATSLARSCNPTRLSVSAVSATVSKSARMHFGSSRFGTFMETLSFRTVAPGPNGLGCITVSPGPKALGSRTVAALELGSRTAVSPEPIELPSSSIVVLKELGFRTVVSPGPEGLGCTAGSPIPIELGSPTVSPGPLGSALSDIDDDDDIESFTYTSHTTQRTSERVNTVSTAVG
mmetsp:Transcript_1191/g.2198  ORF Transcript_1191/g.2198 Transcript_1191/m.2198 type:complete len:201 (-) Transcript_1191:313-915(-)